jgi:hypothetical protein
LNNPIGVSIATFQKLDDLIHIIEDFDALALVFICWFNQPHILSALLGRHLLFNGLAAILLKINVPLTELVVLVGVQV